ncbi:dipeptide ABC transporter ATP-binding protein [Ensifer sp. ENS05]|uniref:ABC transporter ATP-binding protein n=1 Tax=Ensifer sp. ENS05 TaxID=2769277 RepID=UPI0017867318|nr:dipeptide ABC transporter ATP-binding protein [Ensifer sp. ENS05]MBD9596926.1 dipeptide ABC transporter ATP-binding protein [Ensifer sp. ENS05]
MNAPILSVKGLKTHFRLSAGLLKKSAKVVHAVDGVSFDLMRGETLSIVGESGCGKSTVGRSILRLVQPTEGEVILDGRRVDNLSQAAFRPLRKQLQVVFQDPFSSLNPRMKVRDIIAEPIRNFGILASEREIAARTRELLAKVGLPSDAGDRFPHQFSGGQRQRIGIARALAAEPEIIICDEAVSALDVSVKAQIVNLLVDLQSELGLALLFISHDLAIVEHMTHRVAVMYLGSIVETATRRQLFATPKHPYTQALLSAVPVPNPDEKRERTILKGEVPSPISPPSGCRFHTRCPLAFDRCSVERPQLSDVGEGQMVACHLYIDTKVSATAGAVA